MKATYLPDIDTLFIVFSLECYIPGAGTAAVGAAAVVAGSIRISPG